MRYSDDPVADFHAWDREQADEMDKLPVCADCGEPICEEHFYMILGDPVCQDCLDNNYRKKTEDYMEG